MDDELYNKLLNLLKSFNNRPNHLLKYLLDNSAFNKRFLNSVYRSKKLNETINPPEFNTIDDIEKFYSSILINDNKKSDEELGQELNKKLNEYITNEMYEEAAKVRDIMRRRGIKKI
jgi:hypothetical protein